MNTKCDKCGTEVPENNDAVVFEAIRTDNPLFCLALSRHLLPVIEDGTVVCEGSPSRAQYLEGQPRDTRGYTYYSDYESVSRKAYAELQNLEPLDV